MANPTEFKSPIQVRTLADGTVEAHNPAPTKLPHSYNLVKLLLSRVESEAV